MSSKKKKGLIITAIILAIIASFFIFKKKPQNEYTTVDLKKGTLIQTVTEVGTVKASQELELNFALNGQVNKITAKVGDLVKKGTVLMELDLNSLILKEKEAASSFDVAQANLNKLLKGATAQDIAISAAQEAQAKSAYSSAENDLAKALELSAENLSQAAKKLADLESSSAGDVTPLEQTVATAQTNLANAKIGAQQTIDNSRDSLLNTADAKISIANSALDYINRLLNDADLKNTFGVKDSTTFLDTKNDYALALDAKAPAAVTLLTAKAFTTEANLKNLVSLTLAYLEITNQTANNCFKSLENTVVSSVLPQATLDAYKTNISANLSAVSTGISAIQSADYAFRNALISYDTDVAAATDALSSARVNLDDALKNARNTYNSVKLTGESQVAAAQSKLSAAKQVWNIAQKQLISIKTPARAEDIDLTRAQLAQAQANLDLIKKQESESQIIAPIDGQISKINYEIGEQVSSKAALTMLTENNFEIEVDISEADISKVKLNDSVVIDFDAFGETRKFSGAVYFIEPAATVISDITYYKVKISLTDTGANLQDIKAGMTANVTITTNKKDDVWLVPARAVIDKNGSGKIVRVLDNGNKVQEIPVTIGISGNDGLIEINGDGLAVGQKIVTFIKVVN
ncbi:MAG: efflux RND transporter periplasmic adaptor subunit [bacterium]|nr:efflux RND transporter periplasmic adaptor subunit [bacterium]